MASRLGVGNTDCTQFAGLKLDEFKKYSESAKDNVDSDIRETKPEVLLNPFEVQLL